jgi:TPR repeat protein
MKAALALCLLLLAGRLQAGAFDQAMADMAQGRPAAASAQFHTLALGGDLSAAHNLAVLFALGLGVPQSDPDAAYWAWRALLGGLTQAGALADLTLMPLDATARQSVTDRLEADLLPQAHAGDGNAMLALAVVLAVLRPEPALLDAHGWQAIAGAIDHPGAMQARAQTHARMTPEQRAQAQPHALRALSDWCDARAADAPMACSVILVPVAQAQR